MWARNLNVYKRNHKDCSKAASFIMYKNILIQQRTFTSIPKKVLNYTNITHKKSYFLTSVLHSTTYNVNHQLADQEKIKSNTFTYRTHTCGALRPEDKGMKVVLCGWVQFSRLSKFLLLRDAYGLTQCIVTDDIVNLADIPLETVVKIEGTVTTRPNDMVNPNMATGEVEVIISKLEVLNTVSKLPFNLRDYQKPKEKLRLQHRYIDLRFPDMQNILRLRSNMLHNMRRFLVEKHAFVEVETPTLFCRTPGGAREFVVPTHHPGLFYSLVQSPQQFKQMLMSGGVDRYFQIARCYRDETTRPDRQPEFTQLDIELSFTNMGGVLSMVEQLLYETFVKALPKPPFARIPFKQALESYGTDKPNVAFDLKLVNVKKIFTEQANDNDFGAYALPYTNRMSKLTTKYKEKIREYIKKYPCKVVLNEQISKELGTEVHMKVKACVGEENSVILAFGDSINSAQCLGEIRLLIAEVLESNNLLVKHDPKPLWVIDFPLFTKGVDGLQPCHHLFTAPHPDDIHLLDTEPLKVRSLAYDIVMNGNEMGGGSVRIHNAELQEKVMKMLNIDPLTLSHFLNALKCGCPPHAGIALGIDRIIGTACNAESLREVIAFPKSHDGRDPLSGAPNRISDDDKKYYHISTVE